MLTGELASFTDLYTHAVEVNKNADATLHQLTIHFDGDADYARWGLLLGDYVHCLRSALDHLVYAFAVAESQTEPPPDASKVMMPLKSTEQGFRDAGYRIASLGDVVRTRIESLQPYPDRPQNVLLGVLDDMDIRDKHRILPVLAFHQLESAMTISNAPGGATMRARSSHNPLKDGAPFMTYVFDRPAPYVKVEGNAAFSILIPDGEPIKKGWWDAAELIRELRADTRRAIERMLGGDPGRRAPLRLLVGHDFNAVVDGDGFVIEG